MSTLYQIYQLAYSQSVVKS